MKEKYVLARAAMSRAERSGPFDVSTVSVAIDGTSRRAGYK